MRLRLLAGPGALADYEIIEMLLFLGIPRRDTKPAAKGLINRLGSLAGVLTAEREALHDMPSQVAEAFALVVESAKLLATAERGKRVVLNDWDAIDRFLSEPAARADGLSVLLLNNRNQLLAECRLPDVGAAQFMLRHALDRHAVAAFLLRTGGDLEVTEQDRTLLRTARASGGAVSVLVHDMIVLGGGDWIRVGPV